MTNIQPAGGSLPGARSIIAFVVMLAANSIQALVFCVPPPLLPALSKAFNAGNHGVLVAQFVSPIAGLGMMLGAGLSGFLIARSGLRGMMLGASLAIAALGSAPLWTGTAILLLASRLLLGFVAALMLTCSTLLVVENFTAESRPRMIGYQASFSGVIFVAAVMLSGIILRFAGWRASFAIYAVFGLTVFFLSLVSVRPQSENPVSAQAGDSGGVIKRFWPIYLTLLPLGTLITIAGVQLPFVLTSRGIVSPVVQSFIIGNSTIFSAIIGFSYGSIQASIGRRGTLGLSLISAGLGLLVLGFAGNAISACIGTALIGLGQGIFISYMIALTVRHSSPAAVGRAVGYAVAGLFLGSFMNPFVMNTLGKLSSPVGALFITGALTLAGAAACLAARRGLLIGLPNFA